MGGCKLGFSAGDSGDEELRVKMVLVALGALLGSANFDPGKTRV
jgi:hypothetical protein